MHGEDAVEGLNDACHHKQSTQQKRKVRDLGRESEMPKSESKGIKQASRKFPPHRRLQSEHAGSADLLQPYSGRVDTRQGLGRAATLAMFVS